MHKKIFALLLAVLLMTALPVAAMAGSAYDPEMVFSGTYGSLSWKADYNSPPYSLTVSGSGAMQKTDAESYPWHGHFMQGKSGAASKIAIESGVTSIADDAFNMTGCQNISIAGTVTSIGARAFQHGGTDGQNSPYVASVEIPGSVKTIGAEAFGSFNGLSFVLHNGVEEIGDGAFASRALKSIYLPASLKKIGTGVLSSDSESLKDIYYAGSEADFNAKGLTQLGYSAGVRVHYNTPAPGDPQPPKPTVGGFSDVFEGDYYADPVLWAVENQVTNGTSPTTFSPGKFCTRGQIVTFLWNAEGQPEPKNSVNPFTDVKAGDYYYKAVLWAVENNITNGLTATTFGPGKFCTRAQAVTFLWNAQEQPEPKSSANPFTDVKAGEYYYQPVLWAVENQITNGTSPTTFSPGKFCTRGQIVTFLYNAKH